MSAMPFLGTNNRGMMNLCAARATDNIFNFSVPKSAFGKLIHDEMNKEDGDHLFTNMKILLGRCQTVLVKNLKKHQKSEKFYSRNEPSELCSEFQIFVEP